MRYLCLLMLVMLLLVGCASQKIYNYKGIYYPEKGAQELDALIKLNKPAVPEDQHAGHSGENLLFTSDRIYFPVVTYYRADNLFYNYSTIYAIDKENYSISDSLVLREGKSRHKYSHIAMDKDLFIIGMTDSLCHIIKTDMNLNVIQDHPVEFKVSDIYYAGMYDGKLRLVMADEKNDVLMYDFRIADLTVERKRLLLKDVATFQSNHDKSKLWFVQRGENQITTARIDVSTSDPNPVYKDFSYPDVYGSNYNYYLNSVTDSTLYFTWRLRFEGQTSPPPGTIMHKLIAVDYNSGKVINKIENRPIAYDVKMVNGKTYFYEFNTVQGRYQQTISETTPDLINAKQIVSFLASGDKVFAGSIDSNSYKIYTDGNKLYVTGLYAQDAGLAKNSNLKTNLMSFGRLWQPQIFLAVYSLK